MPVFLDTIPEKATTIARPNSRRWLLFLAFVMLVGIVLTLWHWPAERSGFVFWFTALGLPFCIWGLTFALRRFAYKAEQVGAESRNRERERLIDREIHRGQRNAWILGRYIQTSAGNKGSDLLKAMDRAAPAIDFSTPRGYTKPVRYSALVEFQNSLSEELGATVSKLSTRAEGIVKPLPEGLPCWLMLDSDPDLSPLIEEQLKTELSQRTGRIFRVMTNKGIDAFDTWLDKHWEIPGILVVITLSLPAMPLEGDADAVTMLVLSNRKALPYPDAVRLHRPEKGTEVSLTKTLNRALLWAKVRADELQGSWFSGPALTQGSGWNQACEENGVIFSLSEENFSIDSVLGYTGHAAPWVAITLADSAFEQRGVQVVAAQPSAGKDDLWIAVVTKE